MFTYKQEKGHFDCTVSGSNRIVLCSFKNIQNLNLIGAAITLNLERAQFYCSECLFFQCSAKTSSGIHITTCANIDISKLCGSECYSKTGYSFFSYLNSVQSLVSILYSTYNCSGELDESKSSTCFSSPQQTLTYINSTYNKGFQESGFLIKLAEYSSAKYIEACSNSMNNIGMNFYQSKICVASRIHYENCTLYQGQHIQCHITTDVFIYDSYMILNKGDNNYPVGPFDAKVTIRNFYIIGATKFHSDVNIQDDSMFTEPAKTTHFLFLNTELCRGDMYFKCQTRNRNLLSIKIALVLILFSLVHNE